MPTNNVQVNYEAIDAVTQQMDKVVKTVNPELTQLCTVVENLLGDGLWLQQYSPQMTQNFVEFTGQVTKVVENINQYAEQFKMIVSQVKEMDDKLVGYLKQSGH
jgi:uncharacterized protein YukE